MESKLTITINGKNSEETFKSEAKYDEIKIEDVNCIFSPDELNKYSSHLNDGGKLDINLSQDLSNKIDELIGNLKLAGFFKVTQSENKLNVSCTKKTWGKKNTDKKVENTWKTINIEAKSDLIVEDELIDPFDSYQKFSKAEDCITRPKPCKNCNCGRADKESQEKAKKIDPNFKPECGKCYLGDAFRCQGCPYRGLPAFEPGQKVEFKNVSQTDGVSLEEQKTVVNVKDNKVNIDLSSDI